MLCADQKIFQNTVVPSYVLVDITVTCTMMVIKEISYDS